jgi:hypothetical protein
MTRYFWNTGLCLLMLGVCSVQGQSVDLGFSINPDSAETKRYEFTRIGIDQTYILMPYGSPEILNPKAINILKDKRVTQVDLVYTAHPRPQTFEILNKQRLAALYSIAPEIFSSPSVKWTFVRQTDCSSYEEAIGMFHGFAITYATGKFLSERKSEINTIDEVISGKKPPEDSTVLNVFERNKDWKNMLVVTDFTGSMTPYTVQLLLWHKLNFRTNKAKHFVFFNDGDSKPDFEKEIGKTGGIYHIDTKDFKKVLNTAYKTISNGNGGDTEENDLEAILAGMDSCKDCTDIILIADNNSDMRDFKLFVELKIPVKIIVCGTKNGINPDYLTLARKTGGSVHTIEEDIKNLTKYNEGETVIIMGYGYIITGDKFLPLKT